MHTVSHATRYCTCRLYSPFEPLLFQYDGQCLDYVASWQGCSSCSTVVGRMAGWLRQETTPEAATHVACNGRSKTLSGSIDSQTVQYAVFLNTIPKSLNSKTKTHGNKFTLPCSLLDLKVSHPSPSATDDCLHAKCTRFSTLLLTPC